MDFLEEELEEILNIFREESEEIIEKLNQNFLKLEAAPKSKALIVELFRDAHSIKGSSRMTGLNDIQAIAHKLEDILGLAKEDKITITPQAIDFLCKAVDVIASIVQKSVETKGKYHSEKTDVVINLLNELEVDLLKGNTESSPPVKAVAVKREPDTVLLAPEILSTIDNNLKALKSNLSDIDAIISINENLSNLSERISFGRDTEIYSLIENLKSKFHSIINGSRMLIPIEFNEIAIDLYNIGDFIDIPINKYEMDVTPNIIIESNQQPIINITPSASDNIFGLVDFVEKNFYCINEPTSPLADEVIGKIEKILAEVNIAEARQIFEKVSELATIIKDNTVKPDKEILDLILQSFEAGYHLISSPESMTDDVTLVIQRLAILKHMIQFTDNEQTQASDQPDDMSSLSINTEIVKINNEAFNQDRYVPAESGMIKTLRVDTRKLDQLVNQVGELIIAKIKTKEHLSELEKVISITEDRYRALGKAKQFLKYLDKKAISAESQECLNLLTANKAFTDFFEDSSTSFLSLSNNLGGLYRKIQEDDARLNIIINGLEEMVKSIRVLPLATIFHMFPRMVRDISREKNKQIELDIVGSETSVDKKIIEEIKSPLMHIIRNSIDHGIESPQERLKMGKSPTGRILLSATHLENSVLIEVVDDGKGISIESIKQKALEKGLLTHSEIEGMNEHQLMNIIFLSGFSTENEITDISGRGVGLDVVHTKITQLGGKVSIKSVDGESCRISILIPVTMATIPSFIVEVNKQIFAIPTTAVKTAFWINKKEIFKKEGRDTIIHEEKTIPVLKLSKILELPDTEEVSKDKQVVIILQSEELRAGFVIDKLLGDQEILHKKLSPPLIRVRNIAGVTTLGAGELCFILNITDLLKSAHYHTSHVATPSQNEKSATKQEKPDFIKKHPQKPAAGGKIKAKKKILVTDDSATTRILQKNILTAAGYEVVMAENGLQALDVISTQSVDMVISDVEMPQMDGLQLTYKIKSNFMSKNLPVVLLTSLGDKKDRDLGMNVGANAYLVKGQFDQDELLNTVKGFIGSPNT